MDSTFTGFPRTMDFDELALYSCLSRCHCLHVGFEDLNSTSNMVSVVVRPGSWDPSIFPVGSIGMGQISDSPKSTGYVTSLALLV